MKFWPGFFLRLLICSFIVFGISALLLPFASNSSNGTLPSGILNSAITALFLLLNFPLWIMGKSPNIFALDNSTVYLALAMNACFYGLLLSAWLSNTKYAKKRIQPRRSVE